MATYRYGPWGEVLSAEGTCAGQPIRYAGYYHDAETGLYDLKGRYYSPALGRFLTRDPASAVGEYGYCLNNPEGYTDQSGCVATATPEGTAADNPDWEADLALLLVAMGSTDPEMALKILDMIAAGFIIAVVVLSGGGVLAIGGVLGATSVVFAMQAEVLAVVEADQGRIEGWELAARTAWYVGVGLGGFWIRTVLGMARLPVPAP